MVSQSANRSQQWRGTGGPATRGGRRLVVAFVFALSVVATPPAVATAAADQAPTRAAATAGPCTQVSGVVVVGANETLPCVNVHAGGTLELYNGSGCGSSYPPITLTLTSGGTIEAGGHLGMYTSNSCDEGGDSSLDVAAGSLVNHGTILATWRGPGPHTPTGGRRTITGSVTNDGTVIVADTLYLGGPATWDNAGSFEIEATGPSTCQAWAEAQTKGVTFNNEATGSIFSTGLTGCAGQTTGDLRLDGGDKFFEAGPIVAKTGPVVTMVSGTLAYRGGGHGTVQVQGATSLSGDIDKGQMLVLDGTNGYCQEPAAVVTAATGFDNEGTITWGCTGGSTSLTVASGTLANSGAINGLTAITGNLSNTGTVTVGNSQSLVYEKGTFTNFGALSLAGPNATFSVPGAAHVRLINKGTGSIRNLGTFSMASGNTFVEAGTISGNNPVLAGDTLAYTGTGKSTIVVQGPTALSGDISKGQALLLYGGSGFCQNPSAAVTAAVGFTNAGIIAGTCGGGPVTFTVKSGTLVNTGLFGGDLVGTSVDLEASVDNKGTLESGPGASLTIRSLTNYSPTNKALVGGTYIADTGNGIIVPGLQVRTLDATVSMSGTTLNNGTTDALADLTRNEGNLTLNSITETLAGPLTNSGQLTVGDDASLRVTDFTQTSSGTLTTVLLNTSYYGQLATAGTASLAGALAISGATGYKLAAGTAIPVVTYSARTGKFATVRSTTGGLRFVLHYTPSGVKAVVK